MSIDGPGREQLRTLAARLKDAGDEGKGFRKELMKQLDEAAKPLAAEIADPAHLEQYMPHRYALILAADISVRSQKIFASNPRVSISAKTRRERRRKVNHLDDGLINHPKWPHHLERKKWKWQNNQTAGMRPGFFTDPCEKAAPKVRERILAAITETAGKVTDEKSSYF